MNKKLYRVEDNKIIAGVCGGLAEYFNLDASLVRIGFALLTILGGCGVLLYLIMWVIVPTKSKVA